MTSDKIRVLFAENRQPAVEEAAKLLDSRFVVVGVPRNGGAVIRAAVKLQPQIAIFDMTMPVIDGIRTAHHLRTTQPSCKIVMLVELKDQEFVDTALDAGAHACIFKSQFAADLPKAIEAVLAERIFTSQRKRR
jgi:DNA-binding NarL/FixJ family response regulator